MKTIYLWRLCVWNQVFSCLVHWKTLNTWQMWYGKLCHPLLVSLCNHHLFRFLRTDSFAEHLFNFTILFKDLGLNSTYLLYAIVHNDISVWKPLFHLGKYFHLTNWFLRLLSCAQISMILFTWFLWSIKHMVVRWNHNAQIDVLRSGDFS